MINPQLQAYFNELIINHHRRDDILKKIKATRLNDFFNENGIKGIIDHFETIGILRQEGDSHLVDYNVLNDYFVNNKGLLMRAKHMDSEYQSSFLQSLTRLAHSPDSNIDSFCKPYVETFSEFSPDIVLFTGYGGDMARALAKSLGNAIGKKVEAEHLSRKGMYGELQERKSCGTLIYRLLEQDLEDKCVLIADRLMDPFTIKGMVETVQAQGAKVLGVAGLFATERFDPEYALSAAKIKLAGWKETPGNPFSPGFGKFAFYFPTETAMIDGTFKLYVEPDNLQLPE